MKHPPVPFLDLGAAYAELQGDIESAVLASLRSGWYIGGSEVEAFEGDFAAYCGVPHCVAVSNGLDALQLALRVLGVGPGDEVLVPSNTFIATWFAVSQVGAVPVPVEPDPATFNMDPAHAAAAITQRTRAMIPVHLYGQPADLDPLLALARRHSLYVVEDAAQAQGARYHGQRIGGHADLVCWSFYPGKNLGALGDAGAVTTHTTHWAEALQAARNYGSRQKYVSESMGGNHRLDPVQAAALRVKLRHLDDWNARRSRAAARYADALQGTGLQLPAVPAGLDPSWHLYVVQCPWRDALQQHLAAAGIGTQIHYPIAPHLQRAYAPLGYRTGDLPIAERMAREVLSLPIGPHLTVAQQDAVIDAVRAFRPPGVAQ